MAESFSEGKIK
jgi:hypothetical protein